MGEKERNSSFFTDVWFLLISGQEKTEKMDKTVSVWKLLSGAFIELLTKKWITFHQKMNGLSTYLT